MSDVRRVFWRGVTKADYFNVERGPDTGPTSGGGQLYFSISFGDHMSHLSFAEFLNVTPPDTLRRERPTCHINAMAIGDSHIIAPIEFHARYRPPNPDERYYIARQNRRRATGERHPAWLPERGFPSAPPDISGPDDPAIPDLSALKIYVLQAADGSYYAGFVNATVTPRALPPEVQVLFRPNAECPPNGLLVLEPGTISVDEWRVAAGQAARYSVEELSSSPEVEDASDAVRKRAGKRTSGQGFRQSQEDRRAIDRHAMAVATQYMKLRGWAVEDVSTTRSYDLHCTKRGETLHLEVKGTTSDGSVVLLTPNEVDLAHDRYPATALLIVHGVVLDRQGDSVAASGGATRLLQPWNLDEAGELRAIGYQYALTEPSGDD